MSKAIIHAYPWSFFPEKAFSTLLLLFISFSFPIFAKFSGKLELTEVTPPMNTEMKCEACPCSNPCTQQVTTPPPPPPPSPPPPLSKDTPTQNCSPPAALLQTPPPPAPAPPPPKFIYVTGVPGEPSQSGSNHYNWIYYYSGVAERPVNFLALALWGSLSVLTMIGFL